MGFLLSFTPPPLFQPHDLFATWALMKLSQCSAELHTRAGFPAQQLKASSLKLMTALSRPCSSISRRACPTIASLCSTLLPTPGNSKCSHCPGTKSNHPLLPAEISEAQHYLYTHIFHQAILWLKLENICLKEDEVGHAQIQIQGCYGTHKTLFIVIRRVSAAPPFTVTLHMYLQSKCKRPSRTATSAKPLNTLNPSHSLKQRLQFFSKCATCTPARRLLSPQTSRQPPSSSTWGVTSTGTLKAAKAWTKRPRHR